MRKIFLAFLLSLTTVFGQDFSVKKVEPANWWTGMKLNKIQLLVYGKNLSGFSVSANTKSIKVDSVHFLANKDYSFVDLKISSGAAPGNYQLIFSKEGKKISVPFPLLKRESTKNRHQGFGNEDVVYLIMPDRFADGDPSNNEIEGMQNDYKPESPLGRHGGDLQGIMNNLGYLKELGVTSLWLTPVLENHKSVSYHGYAATDLYLIDRRLGTNEKYKELVDKAHEAGLKIIYDHVSNHIGASHVWLNSLPVPDWINGVKGNHLNAWHDKMIDYDIHGAAITNEYLRKGWFVDDMADLNQQNKYVKNYLIQNTIWWIEYTGLDGIREDTYPYADKYFLADWAKAVMNEYPRFNIVGEVWTGVAPFLAASQKDSKLNKGFNTNLPVVTDFAIQNAYSDFLEGKQGLYKIYETLTQDFLYENSNNLLTFADNHDIARIMLVGKENAAKVKLVLTHLFTSRGTPQILYATEIGMVGGWDHGILRTNFPGGFNGDKANAFTKEGRTEKQNDMFEFTKTLLGIRKNYPPLQKGVLKHLPPINGVYIYTRKLGNQTILVALNESNSERKYDMKYIHSLCGKDVKLKDIMNNSPAQTDGGTLLLKPMSGNIFIVNN